MRIITALAFLLFLSQTVYSQKSFEKEFFFDETLNKHFLKFNILMLGELVEDFDAIVLESSPENTNIEVAYHAFIEKYNQENLNALLEIKVFGNFYYFSDNEIVQIQAVKIGCVHVDCDKPTRSFFYDFKDIISYFNFLNEISLDKELTSTYVNTLKNIPKTNPDQLAFQLFIRDLDLSIPRNRIPVAIHYLVTKQQIIYNIWEGKKP